MNRSLKLRFDASLMTALFAGVLLVPATVEARQTPPAWLGVSLECSNCRLIHITGQAPTSSIRGAVRGGDRWGFSSPPRILAVEKGSPAERAGLLRGDLLTHIDGVRLTTDEGSERLAAVAPGQTVEWTYERSGERRTAKMVVDTRPAPPMPATVPPQPRAADPPPPDLRAIPPRLPAARDNTIRFSGDFAGTHVTVRGPATTVVRLVEGQCWLEIQTADTVIRVSAPGKCDALPDTVSGRSESSERRAPSSSPSAK